MINQKELLERPDLARPPAQRPAPRRHAARRGDAATSGFGPGPGPRPLRSVEPAAGCAASAASPAHWIRPLAPRTGGSEELAATLERLAGLRDRGLITPEEYETKKRDILERM